MTILLVVLLILAVGIAAWSEYRRRKVLKEWAEFRSDI